MKRDVRCYFNGDSFDNPEEAVARLLVKAGYTSDSLALSESVVLEIFADLQLNGELGRLMRHTFDLKKGRFSQVVEIDHISETLDESIGLMAYGWLCSVIYYDLDLKKVEKEMSALENKKTVEAIDKLILALLNS